MSRLRTYCFLDTLQPQFASYVATTSRGYLPIAGQASLWVETAPGMVVNEITDVALKSCKVTPAMQVVERSYGLLEVHSEDQGEVRQAGQAILDFMGLEESDRLKPRIVTNTIIRKVDDYQSMLINRIRYGNMLLGGQTLFILETEPAGYAAFAANEAEKAAHINIVEVRAFGAYGRVYLGGEEADVVAGAEAAVRAVETLTGTELPEKK